MDNKIAKHKGSFYRKKTMSWVNVFCDLNVVEGAFEERLVVVDVADRHF
jgi:hypothetical protein